jgi:hypothetical protein
LLISGLCFGFKSSGRRIDDSITQIAVNAIISASINDDATCPK